MWPSIKTGLACQLQKVGISSVVLPLNLTFLSNRSQNPSAFQVSTSHRLQDVLSRPILLLSSQSENWLIILASLLLVLPQLKPMFFEKNEITVGIKLVKIEKI